MYRVIEIAQGMLPEYKGKIVQVLSREKKEIQSGFRGYYELYPETYPVWVLTCLVEEEEEK